MSAESTTPEPLDLGQRLNERCPATLGVIEGHSYLGREGMERFFAEMDSVSTDVRFLEQDARDVVERVIVHVRVEGRGRGSDLPITSEQGIVYDFCDRKIARARSYRDQVDALEAIGSEK